MDDPPVDSEIQDQAKRAWEQTNDTWLLLHEDENGRLRQIPLDDAPESELIRKRLALRHRARGLIRSIAILIDLSERAMAPRDFSCPRVRLIVSHLRDFLTNFFDQNPISQIAITATYNGQGHILTPLCGSLDLHLKCVDNLSNWPATASPRSRIRWPSTPTF
jgi:transcription initiation factor TFIIH subunit 2